MNRKWLLVLVAIGLSGIVSCHSSTEQRKTIARHVVRLENSVQRPSKSINRQTALHELIEIANGDWSFARCQAIEALGRLGALAKPAVPDLIRAATCGDMFVEEAAFHALAQMGPTADPAVDLMIDTIEIGMARYSDRTGSIYWHAADGLGNIGRKALKAIPVLEQASIHADPTLAKKAKVSLDNLRKLSISSDST